MSKKGKATKYLRWLGIALIVCGVGLLGYHLYEKLRISNYQKQLHKNFDDLAFELPGDETFDNVVITEKQPMRLVIPKINVDLIVQVGDVYDDALQDRGPVHFENSALPSTESGNVAVAGHRGSYWGFFTDLDQLESGDQLYIDVEGYRFIYQTEWIRIVEPDAWEVIDPTEYPALTLQTCHPKNVRGTHRLIVRARLDRVTQAS